MELKKIKDKKEIEVLSQYNCTVINKPTIYEGANDNCLADCTSMNHPAYYGSPNY